MNPADPDTAWDTAQTIAAVFAVDPRGLGGVDLVAFPGPVRDSWLEYLGSLIPATPFRPIPLNVSESRLLGSLDVAATLRSGTPQHSPGLLAECDGRVVQLCMAERVEARVVAHVCAALDNGWVATAGEPAKADFGVVALNEGLDDEKLAEPLADRLAFRLELGELGIGDITGGGYSTADVDSARRRLPDLHCPIELLETLCTLSLLLGVNAPRAWQHTSRCARVLAALRGATAVEEPDIIQAGQLVMGHRATRLPQMESPEEAEDTETPPDAETPPEPPEEQTAEKQDSSTPPEQQLIEAAAAAIPADLLRQLAAGARRQKGRSQAGKSGASQQCNLRGRPIGARRGDPRRGGRLDVLSTLRAAVPWQGLRRPDASADRKTPFPAIIIHKDDFRIVRYKHRADSTTIFVVDASGSSALHRLGEAKGAIERLLADCYSRRDSVALIAFRGEQAEVLLPPTRSLVRVKRSLAALPGGGGTPLASAIELCEQMVDQTQRVGATPGVVMLTDGVANIARDGTRGRETATEDALKAARLLAQRNIASLLIDTSPRPQTRAQRLAQALDARYFALPHADSQRLYTVIRDHAGQP